LKKVLIISYFYPPANFAGSHRIYSWSNELKKRGYQPIIVTRHWNDNETEFTPVSKENYVTISNHEGIEIHRVPFRGSMRDRVLGSSKKNYLGIGKVLSFFQLILENYFPKLNPAYELFREANKVMLSNSDLEIVITSGRPFYQFIFADQLKKKHDRIKWYGDYRDPWNTNTNIESSLKRRFFRYIETPIEKRVIKSAESLITCSEGFKSNIKELIKHKEIHVITNGFSCFIRTENKNKNKKLEIAYVGSLYDNQKIERFLKPLNHIANIGEIKLVFYGFKSRNKALKKIETIVDQTHIEIEIKPWMEKNQMIAAAINHDCFLLCGIPARKGTYTAKFFDYLAMQKNIILCPSDNDILEKEIIRLNVGTVLKSEEEVLKWYSSLKGKGFKWEYNGNVDKIEGYKNSAQVDKLISIISNLPSNEK
jgi:glycosyltransferase involved in cell wall biosynthesis